MISKPHIDWFALAPSLALLAAAGLLLMVAVFGAFALTGIMPIQQLGLSLAVAIALLDVALLAGAR